jgi:hypothetical protein
MSSFVRRGLCASFSSLAGGDSVAFICTFTTIFVSFYEEKTDVFRMVCPQNSSIEHANNDDEEQEKKKRL